MPAPSSDFAAMVARFEANPNLRGKTVAQVPELADLRLKFRRQFYRWANVHFGFTLFNFMLAASDLSWFWWLNALCAGLSWFMMLFSERTARSITRQLHRPAAEQMARDILGVRD